MTILQLIVALIVIGVLLWLFNAKVTTIDSTIKSIINIVAIILAVVLVLKTFGLLDSLGAVTA